MKTKEFACSNLVLRAVDEERRILTGIATTPTPDRMGDIVEPKGALFELPIPFLWQHRSSEPIGHVTKAKVTASGIEVEVQIARITEPGKLKDRIDEAWQSIKAGLVRGLSIGFTPTEYAMTETGYRFIKWLWLELSGVTIPANAEGSIATVKSLDLSTRAALGITQTGLPRPGASGTRTTTTTRSQSMKTLAQMREERAQKSARMGELAELMQAPDHEFTDEEDSEFNSLETEIKDLDRQIKLARFQSVTAATATPVEGRSASSASQSRAGGGMIIVKNADKDDSFAGQGFIRKAMAEAAQFLARKKGQHLSAAEFAQKRWGKMNPQMVQWIKANEVAGGGTGSGEWGAELVGIDNRYTGDFVKYLNNMTALFRLGLRPAPHNVSVKGQDGAAIGYWVGESKAIPVSKPDFSTTDLTALKAAGISIASKELLADSDPAAEQLIRDALGEAISQRADTTFFSTDAASAGVSPAGILNGVTPVAWAGGTDEAAVRTMIKALYSGFITDKNSTDLKLVMNPGQAKAIGLLVNALGQTSFPGLGTKGGMLLEDPVITGDNVDGSAIILLKPSDIWLIDLGIETSMSDSAMIEQNSAPTGATDTPTAASVTMTSMFQEDSVAIKVTRRMSWKKRRANAVRWISDADFDGTAS